MRDAPFSELVVFLGYGFQKLQAGLETLAARFKV